MPTSPPVACPCGGRKIKGVCDRGCDKAKRTHPQTTTQRGLGWKWQQLVGTKRKPGIVRGQLCKDCLDQNRTTPAVQGHHIQKRVDRPDLAYDPENIIPLCEACHCVRTARGE